MAAKAEGTALKRITHGTALDAFLWLDQDPE